MESIFGLEYEKVLRIYSEALNHLYEIPHHFFATPAEKIFSSLCAISISWSRFHVSKVPSPNISASQGVVQPCQSKV